MPEEITVDSTQKVILIAALLSPITYPIGLVKRMWRKIFPTRLAGEPSNYEIHKEETDKKIND